MAAAGHVPAVVVASRRASSPGPLENPQHLERAGEMRGATQNRGQSAGGACQN